jgi:hypothetical protein
MLTGNYFVWGKEEGKWLKDRNTKNTDDTD